MADQLSEMMNKKCGKAWDVPPMEYPKLIVTAPTVGDAPLGSPYIYCTDTSGGSTCVVADPPVGGVTFSGESVLGSIKSLYGQTNTLK